MTNNNPENIKKKQQLNLIMLVSVVLLICWALYAIFTKSSEGTDKPMKGKKETVSFANPLKKVDPESVVLQQTEETEKETAAKNADLMQKVTTLTQQQQDQQKAEAEKASDVSKLESMVSSLQQKVNELETKSVSQQVDKNGHIINTDEGGISSETLNLVPIDNPDNDVPDKNPENYVPAGSFAKGVLIEAADDSAAVNAQANPMPMKVKIIDDGSLPNGFHSHLKGCIITLASTGDISSERGFIRTERLSCVRPTGEIIETPIEGDVSGMDGKSGVRGTPVWREGALLQRAFVAGTLSGFSNGIQQKYTTNSISPLGTTQTVNSSDIFKYGAAGGASNAMDKLADYEIQRAEQYHPVIQISGGQPVDVNFLKGFYIDGKEHKSNDDSKKSSAPTSTLFNGVSSDSAQNGGGSQQLPMTPEEQAKLKERAAELGFSTQQS